MAPALPAELIRRILELTDVDKRNETLCNASLVARSWRHEAQAALWSRVDLYKADRARRFVGSPATQRWLSQGIRKVQVLHIYSSSKADKQHINAGLAENILDVCPSVKALTLSKIVNCIEKLLYHPSLSNLKRLDIHLDLKWNARKLAQISAVAPYTLDTANLSSYQFTPGVHVIRPLFLASQASLRKLSVIVNASTTPIWQAVFPLVSSSIVALALVVEGNIMPPAFPPLLSAFTSLQFFHYRLNNTQHLSTLLNTLPQIKTLRIEPDTAFNGAAIVAALRQPAASALETLEMSGGTLSGPRGTPQQVISECARRSIAHVLVENRGLLEPFAR